MGKILVAGNYCHDTLISAKGETSRTLGGSAAYISAILGALEVDFELVAKVGADFAFADQVLRSPTVDPERPTTHCLDDYSSGLRRETIDALGAEIQPQELVGQADIGLACAVAGELPPASLAQMRALCGRVICDVQGLVRHIGPDGRVENRALAQTRFHESLQHLDILKANEEEAEMLDLAFLRRRSTVIVTLGDRGCTLYDAAGGRHVAGFPAAAVDPTGAGDCFTAGLAAALLRGNGLGEAARFANHCGALAVRTTGVPRLQKSDFPDLQQGLDASWKMP